MKRLRDLCLALGLAIASHANVQADDDDLLFTPTGFDRPGKPATATGPEVGVVDLTILDSESNRPTPCRINVVGPDGQFYQPDDGPLTPYSLTGDWPKSGKGNREGKGPFRYYGRFFYTTGRVKVRVPAGQVRVEVWKGLEYRPSSATITVTTGKEVPLNLRLERATNLGALGYDSGDPHLHLLRRDEADESVIFDLLDAEDVRYGTPLGYNEPAGPYHGVREELDYPQLRGLGKISERRRGDVRILSGQEYRSRTFGHLNLYLRDGLVNEGQRYDLDRWPPYGTVGRETIRQGGFAFYAHGGYAQAIYADFARNAVNGVELLQFGEYRGIGLADWYHILNTGYRFPIVGASDYPACRKLADCITYAYQDPSSPRDFQGWLKAAAEGRSFVTTGPLLLLEVDGEKPGAVLARSGPGPHRLMARVRVLSNVAPVRTIQIILNGEVVEERAVPASTRSGEWFEWSVPIDVSRSSWVAARAFGTARTGQPDAESHTNPVYAHVDDRAPYDQKSLDRLVAKLDGQMAVQRARDFPEKAKILDDFQASRDVLMRIRAEGGLPTSGLPDSWLKEVDGAAFDPSRRSHTDAELAEFLKPSPLKSPSEALATFEASAGFELQLVAAEPSLRSPVAAAFDENGDLYVCEMTDYPYKPRPGGTPLGSVRLLRDIDGDGDFDESHVFAEGLLWAAGVAPWKGGVYVASPPDVWYLKDTDGDHRADVRRKVFTGFGTQNEQGMLNNLTFALDHKIFGSTTVNGGLVRHVDRPDVPP
ncbi:MAG: CehA/McbA family metallohydrolase, partial [Isosphaeraceae bacterium]